MLRHFLSLLADSWSALMQKTGTSTLGFILYGIGFTALGWVAVVSVRWWNHPRRSFAAAMYAERFLGLSIVIILTIVMGAAYTVAVVGTIYADHESLVKRARANSLQCWMQNITLNAVPSTVVGAHSASEAIGYCNQERKAPLWMKIDYDTAPIAVEPVQFAEGRQVQANQSLQSKEVFVQITSPSILPYQIFRVEVYGAAESPPLSTGVKIVSVDPER